MKRTKKTVVILAISLALMLISAIVGNVVIHSGGSVSVTMLEDASNMTMVDVDGTLKPFEGKVVSGALFVPKGASPENKLPGIVLTHGYLNDWEKQYQNAIELSRRGFIVVAVDRAGHGDNIKPVEGSLGFGGTLADYDQSLTLAGRYLYNMDIVDRSKIAVSGHSMGGFATSMALAKDATDAYGYHIQLFCAGLQQSWETSYGAAPGVSVGIVKSNDDEFFFKGTDPVTGVEYSSRMWLDTTNARNFVKSTADDPVISGHIYVDGTDIGPVTGGQTAQPGFRAVYEADQIHTLQHFSRTTSGQITNFFYTALGVPNGYSYLEESNQIWWIKEAFGILGIIGFYMLLIPVCDLLLMTPFFRSLRKEPKPISGERALKGKLAWALFLVAGLVGSLIAGFNLRAVSTFAAENWKTSALFPQEQTNWLAYWCFINGLIVVGISIVVCIVEMTVSYFKTGKAEMTDLAGSARASFGTVVKSLVLACTVVTVGMLVLSLFKSVLKVDFRLWLYTVKSINIVKLPTAIRYLPLFFVFYGVNAWNVSNTRYSNVPEWVSTLLMCVFNCLGLALIFTIQYVTFKSTGVLWHTDMGTRYPTLLTVMPILCVSTVYSKKLYNRTGNCWTAAMIMALLAALACVGGAPAVTPYTFL